ncbi:UNKNOWN [Stylonychia lemnae]|uniref:Uncharacterized protein n=1 Tax=Stylonychia lemnae TaxID=5949 RepID=A0A078B7M9_STYLE|nr:UNKNOWN [Stylonychia lemnae]|eukprot:CDW90515.1 UNKNOWN [Stylonychia lemnae]
MSIHTIVSFIFLKLVDPSCIPDPKKINGQLIKTENAYPNGAPIINPNPIPASKYPIASPLFQLNSDDTIAQPFAQKNKIAYKQHKYDHQQILDKIQIAQ